MKVNIGNKRLIQQNQLRDTLYRNYKLDVLITLFMSDFSWDSEAQAATNQQLPKRP